MFLLICKLSHESETNSKIYIYAETVYYATIFHKHLKRHYLVLCTNKKKINEEIKCSIQKVRCNVQALADKY